MLPTLVLMGRRRDRARLLLRSLRHRSTGTQPSSHERRTGRVLRCVFLGSITRVTISVDGAPITIELTGRRDDLAPDREVAIRIPAHAVLQLDDASS